MGIPRIDVAKLRVVRLLYSTAEELD